MHVCIVSDDFLPNIGGVSQHVFEIARCFVHSGHDVTIVNLVTVPGNDTIEELEGIRVVRSHINWSVPKVRMIPYIWKLRGLLRRQHARQPIDVIHWHDLRAGLAIKYFGKSLPTVFTNHSSMFLIGINSGLLRAYYRFSLRHADRLLAPSQELADVTEKLLGRSVTFIPNGFDPDRFHPLDATELRRSLGIGDDEKILLAPRRLAPKNGVYVLAQAMPLILERHPKARVVVTGGGFPDERDRIETFAKQHGCFDRILFLDGVDNKRMPMYYNIADLVIMPSFMEAVSLSALESMGCEKCMVASDVGGLSQLFAGDQWGKLVPPGEPKLLANAVNDLLNDDELRAKLASSAREHVLENYAWSHIAMQTFAVYEEVLNREMRLQDATS